MNGNGFGEGVAQPATTGRSKQQKMEKEEGGGFVDPSFMCVVCVCLALAGLAVGGLGGARSTRLLAPRAVSWPCHRVCLPAPRMCFGWVGGWVGGSARCWVLGSGAELG